MAALTENRRGKVKTTPRRFEENFPLAAGAHVFAHSLVTLTSDSELRPAAAGDDAPVLYSTEEYQSGGINMETGALGETETARVDSGVVVFLDADDLSAAQPGDTVYALDDHTVTTAGDSGDGTGYAEVGTLTQIVSDTEGWVEVRGLRA